MAEVAFSFRLQHNGRMHQWQQGYYISDELKINAEWCLTCLFSSQNPKEPKILEIRRNSTSKEVLVSGTFKLVRGGECLFQRKFMQLIEAGFETTLIELQLTNNHHYYAQNYSITGSLKFPACESNEDYSERIQFKSLLDLSNDLKCLLDPKATYFSDVKINCGPVSFSAHKSILSARSAVFATMFSTQMRENLNNQVDIEDLSPAVLRTMLTYIYTGNTRELSLSGELLFAADKYQIQDLKRVCSDHLKSCVSAENVLRTLVLGDLYDKNLKVFAMDFICSSRMELEVLEKTAEWTTLRDEKPALTMEVLTRLVKSKDQQLKSFNLKEAKNPTRSPEVMDSFILWDEVFAQSRNKADKQG